MIHRFQGEDGQRRLIAALCRQPIIQGDSNLATTLSNVVELRQYEVGDQLIKQGDSDSGT